MSSIILICQQLLEVSLQKKHSMVLIIIAIYLIVKNLIKDLVVKLKEADHILVSIPPENQEDLVIKNFSKFIESSKVKWITYLSATSIYGDHKGEWVNENSKTNPISNNGIARLKAENAWFSLDKNKKLPIQIFRLSGIYSNEKNILMRLKSGGVKLINKKNHFFSRIHVDDISNILFKSLSKFKSGEIYNLSDDKPSTSEEVTLFGAKILNIENIEKIEVDQIKSEMLKNFYNESKKVSNKKMKSYFNYNLKFPSYIEGLNHIRVILFSSKSIFLNLVYLISCDHHFLLLLIFY